jgi:hypothetical protein
MKPARYHCQIPLTRALDDSNPTPAAGAVAPSDSAHAGLWMASPLVTAPLQEIFSIVGPDFHLVVRGAPRKSMRRNDGQPGTLLSFWRAPAAGNQVARIGHAAAAVRPAHHCHLPQRGSPMPSRTSPGAHVLLLLLLPLLLLVAGCATDTAEGAVSTGPIELVFGPAAGYSPVTDPLAAHLLREESASASAVIGPEGGSLELIGHRVRVPAGAVRGPTTFTISGRPGTVFSDNHVSGRSLAPWPAAAEKTGRPSDSPHPPPRPGCRRPRGCRCR